MTTDPDNSTKLVELAYKRSCDALQAQASIASASDQRALVFSTLAIAAAALVYNALKDGEASGSGVGASMFFCASALASAFSAAPGRIYSNGAKADELEEFIQDDTPYTKVLYGISKNNSHYIDENEKPAKLRAVFYRLGLVLFAVGGLIALFGFFAAGLEERK